LLVETEMPRPALKTRSQCRGPSEDVLAGAKPIHKARHSCPNASTALHLGHSVIQRL